MPELPEVEVIRADLEAGVVGRRIEAAQVLNTKNAARVIRRHQDKFRFEQALAGAGIKGAGRRGKYLLLGLDNASTLVVHLGMAGQLIQSPASEPLVNHTHVLLQFTDGDGLRYVDPRTFGEMFVSSPYQPVGLGELAGLGPDALDEPLSLRVLIETLKNRRTTVKALLMNQGFMSGIGNIYSDEILFRAGIRHDRPSHAVSASEVRRLREAIHETLKEAIAHRGTSADDEQYRDLQGRVGSFQHLLNVYQREGRPCRRCGALISRARWSNRSTFFCPKCQV